MKKVHPNRYRGELTPEQLEILIGFTSIRSEKVSAQLSLYFVKGVTCPDVSYLLECHLGTFERNVRKIIRIIDLISVYVGYGILKDGYFKEYS